MRLWRGALIACAALRMSVHRKLYDCYFSDNATRGIFSIVLFYCMVNLVCKS